jgi:hypothetical protein
LTVEEALVALLATAAGILLFLGLAQALDSRRPRRAGSRRRREDGWRRRARGAGQVTTTPTLLLERSRASAKGSCVDPHTDTASLGVRPAVTPVDSPPLLQSTAPIAEILHEESAQSEVRSTEGPATVRASRDADVTLVEACAGLYLAGKHADVLLAAEPRLGRRDDRGSTGCSSAVTGLWSLAALSRQALGDETAARVAFAAALRELQETVVEGCSPRLAAMSVPLARRLLEVAEQSPEASEVRMMAPRLAVFWVRWRLVAAPDDYGTQALLEAARGALSQGWTSSPA